MAAADTFAGSPAQTIGADFPATSAEAVTPSDSVSLANVSRALYVGVSGDLSVLMRDGTSAFIKSAAVGYHPLRVQRVNLTTGGATTATNIVSLS